jgi:hypothetical protein
MSLFNRNLTMHWSGTAVHAMVDSKFTSVRSILPLCHLVGHNGVCYF